jgi:hypothetical protein
MPETPPAIGMFGEKDFVSGSKSRKNRLFDPIAEGYPRHETIVIGQDEQQVNVALNCGCFFNDY